MLNIFLLRDDEGDSCWPVVRPRASHGWSGDDPCRPKDAQSSSSPKPEKSNIFQESLSLSPISLPDIVPISPLSDSNSDVECTDDVAEITRYVYNSTTSNQHQMQQTICVVSTETICIKESA